MLKKFIISNIILTFAMGFIVHNLYVWMPSPLTSIFPVNESLYEHIKLIFYSPIFSVLVLMLIFHYKGVKFHNVFLGLFINIMVNIVLFYLIYLPVYYSFGNIMIVTLIIYLITIAASNYLYYLILKNNNNMSLGSLGIILMIISAITLTYLTYYPMQNDFFKDPENNTYGISKG